MTTKTTYVVVLLALQFYSASAIQPRQATESGSSSQVQISEVPNTRAVFKHYYAKRQNDDNTEGTFWQITDIHWDQRYSNSGDPSMMCHEGYTAGEHIGLYGNYRCDSPWVLVKSAIEAMAEINNEPDFILWTGDSAPHSEDPEPDFQVIFNTIGNVTWELRENFQDPIPIIPVLGNHDAYPKNNYPVAGEVFYEQYLTKGGWAAVLPTKAQSDFKKGGYYAYELSTGVTVLVLNTNLYNSLNELGTGEKDPSGQFAWLRKRLQQAVDGNYKVIITAHIPPGYFERLPEVTYFSATYTDTYTDLVNEFGETIMAHIYGHEHTDSFRLFFADGKTQSAAFIAPSVTPRYPPTGTGGPPINPSIRLYAYNKSLLLDYTQYHLNLTKVNGAAIEVDARGQGKAKTDKSSAETVELGKPKWELYYQARNRYGLQSLNTVNMASLYNKLSSDDTLFQKYYIQNSAGYELEICDSQCKKNHLCAIANIKSKDLNQCIENSHSEDFSGPHSSTTKHPSVPVYVMEDGFPVSDDSFGTSSSSHAVIVVSVSLTVIFAVILVILTIRRSRMVNTESSYMLLTQHGDAEISIDVDGFDKDDL